MLPVEETHVIDTTPGQFDAEIGSGETLEGYGMRSRARCAVARPRSAEEIAYIFARARAEGQSVGLRGAGCSYGDAALNDGQIVLDTSRMTRVLAWNPSRGEITVEPGVTIAQLWQHTLADGWWPAVVPGTMAVTVGGGAAANIHGKNNWRDGCFGDHILTFDMVLPSGEFITCSRERNSDLFHAAIGGFGLLGCFTALTLRLRRVHSGLVHVHQTAHGSLAALLAAVDSAAQSTAAPADSVAGTTHIVGWIDTTAQGSKLGRGLLKVMRELAPGEDIHPERSLDPARQPPPNRIAGVLPTAWIPTLARPIATPVGIRMVNRAQWWRGRLPGADHPHDERYVPANFMLNFIPNFKRIYLPGGLIQQQTFVPAAAAARVFRGILERSQRAGMEPALAVLKKHRPSAFLLNYLPDGYSLALDYAVPHGRAGDVSKLMHELNTIAVAGGGTFFLAKDSTLASEQFAQAMPAATLRQFKILKSLYDPDELLQTDLYRRVMRPALETV